MLGNHQIPFFFYLILSFTNHYCVKYLKTFLIFIWEGKSINALTFCSLPDSICQPLIKGRCAPGRLNQPSTVGTRQQKLTSAFQPQHLNFSQVRLSCEFIRKSLWDLNAAVFHLGGKDSETVCNLNKFYPFPYPRWLKSNKPDIGKLSRLSTEIECLRRMKLVDFLKYNF